MKRDNIFAIFIHDPTTSLFNEYKYRQRGVTGDSESEDEDTRFCKKYGKKEAGASDSFFVARKEPGDLEPTCKKEPTPVKFTSYGVGFMLEYFGGY
jgi:hypothetical protein